MSRRLVPIGLLCLTLLSGCATDDAGRLAEGPNAPAPAVSSEWLEFGPKTANYLERTGRISGRVASLLPLSERSILLGSASGGIWRTDDGGGHWTPLTDGLNRAGVFAIGSLARDPNQPNVIYAGTGEINGLGIYGAGLLRSQDGGRTFSLLPGSIAPFDQMAISKVLVDPGNSGHLLVSSGRVEGSPIGKFGGVFRSLNGGETWTQVISTGGGPDDPSRERPTEASVHYRAYDLARAQGQFLASVQSFVGAQQDEVTTIYRSPDGASWQAVGGEGFPPNAGRVSLAEGSDGRIYGLVGDVTGRNFLGIFLSTDLGDHWVRLQVDLGQLADQIFYNNTLVVDPQNPDRVYVGCFDVARIEVDDVTTGAASMSRLSDGFPGVQGAPHVDHHALVFQGTSLLDGCDGGIWRLDNPATAPANRWTNLNSDLGTIQFTGIALHPTDPYFMMGGTQDNATLYMRGGSMWQQYYTGDGGPSQIDPLRPNFLFSCYQYSQRPEQNVKFIVRSTTGDVQLHPAVQGIDLTLQGQFYPVLIMHPRESAYLAYGNQRVFETVENDEKAIRWAAVSDILTPSYIGALAYAPSDSGILYAATNESHIYLRRQRGGNFVRRDTAGQLPAALTALAVSEADPDVVFATFPSFGGTSVMASRDAGANWTNISFDLPRCPARTVALDGSQVYVGTDEGVFRLSFDHWEKLGKNLPSTRVQHLVIGERPHRLAAGTYGRGAWVIGLDGNSALQAPPFTEGPRFPRSNEDSDD